MTAGRIVLVATSPRTPPGLLSWPAWSALRSGTVLVGSPEDHQLPFLLDAGIACLVQVPTAQQAHDRALAGEVLVLLGQDESLTRELGLLAARQRTVPVEVVYGSYDLPGSRLLDVVAVMDRLRSPGGCPWDAAQTHDSLRPYLLEEAYEAYEALEDGDRAGLREELGDVLLQVAFHARLAQEHAEPWSIDDVAGDLVDKLVRRHPHVFAGAAADDPASSWEARKQAEKGRVSVTDGVPLGQPALSLAARLQRRGARVGVPVPAFDGIGGQLWELVARCRELGLDPEDELRAVARAYRDRLVALERELAAEERDPAGLTAAQWQARWG